MKSFLLIIFIQTRIKSLAQFLHINFLRPEVDLTSDHMLLQNVGKVDYRVEGAKLLCLKVKVFRIKLWAKVTSTPHLRWERFWEILWFEKFLKILCWERFCIERDFQTWRWRSLGSKCGAQVTSTPHMRWERFEVWIASQTTHPYFFLRLPGFSSK